MTNQHITCHECKNGLRPRTILLLHPTVLYGTIQCKKPDTQPRGWFHIKRTGASKLDHHWLPMIDKPGYVVGATVHRAQLFHAVDSCGTIPTWSSFTRRAWQLAGSFCSNIANLIQSGTSPFSCGKARRKGFFHSESRASTPCCWDRLRECIHYMKLARCLSTPSIFFLAPLALIQNIGGPSS